MSADELYQTILRYETHTVDRVRGWRQRVKLGLQHQIAVTLASWWGCDVGNAWATPSSFYTLCYRI